MSVDELNNNELEELLERFRYQLIDQGGRIGRSNKQLNV